LVLPSGINLSFRNKFVLPSKIKVSSALILRNEPLKKLSEFALPKSPGKVTEFFDFDELVVLRTDSNPLK
jgi:hypothetical protein